MTDWKGYSKPAGLHHHRDLPLHLVAGFPYQIWQLSSLHTRRQAVVNNPCMFLHIRNMSA